MLKPTPSKPGLFSVALKQLKCFKGIAVSALIALVLSVLYLVSATPLVASAATNSTLNFQARLESASGAIVPDGNYNVEFKLYNVSSAGTAEWTEDYLNSASQGVHVANGYLTVNLGSITAFPNTINWDQQQWLTMNIGGTTSSPSWDGEMNPRLQLTAVPYAFRAGQLATGNGTLQSTLSITQPTVGNQTFLLPDMAAAGTYTLMTTATGVQLQTSTPGTQQSGNFNVSGTGLVGSLGVGTTSIGSTVLTVQSSANDQVLIKATNDAGFIRPLVMLDANMTATHNLVYHIGHDLSTNDTGYFGFNYQGANSASNFVTLGLYGNDNIVNITGAGNTGLGTQTPKSKLDVAGGVAIGTYAGTTAAPTNGLIVSGGVGIGTSSVGSTALTVQSTANDQVLLTATNDASFIRPLELLDSNMTAGHNIVYHVGHDLSNYDTGYFGFNYQGANSTSNFVTLGLYGNDNIFNITGAGNVGIGNTNPQHTLDVAGTARIQTSTNSTTAFQVQNAAGNPVLNIDTTPTDIVTNGSFEASTSGWAVKGGASMTTNGPGEYGNKSLDVTTGTASGDGVKYNVTLTNGHLYALSFYIQLHAINGSTASGQTWSSLNFGYAQDGATEDAAGLSATNQSITTATNGQWYREIIRFTPSAVSGTPYLYIKQNSTATTSREFYVDGVQLEDITNFGTSTSSFATYSEGNINVSGKITSPLTIAAGSSTAALQVLDSSYGSVFNVDSRLGKVGIGNGTPSSKFMVQSGATDTAANYSVIKGTSTILDATDGGSNNLNLLSLENTASGLTGGASSGEALQVNNQGYVTLQGYSLATAAGAGANAGTSFSLQGATGQAAGGAANLGGSGANLVLAGGAGGASTGTAANSNGGNIYLEGGTAGSGGSGAAGAGGSVIVKSLTNSTTAFQVQSSSSSPVLNVDTTNSYVGIGTASPSRALDVAVNNTQIAAPMSLLEQAGTGDSSMEFKDPSDSIYIGQDADSGDSLIVSSSTAATHNRAGAPYDLGYTSIAHSFDDSGNSGLISSMPFTTSLGGSISQISVDFSAGAGDNFEVAIYADSGNNYPGTLLGSSPSTAISITGSDNWNTASLSSSVTLNPSTKYWLAYETQNGIANYWLDDTKGVTCWQTIGNGTFGSWVPQLSTSCDQGYSVNNTYGIYALVNPVGSSHSLTDTFSNPLMTMTQSGFTTFEGMSNSTTAFQVDNSSASAVLDVDTANGQVGIGTSAPSTALQVAVNNTTTNNLPLSLQQTGSGNTGVQFTTTNGSIYEGEDTDGTFRISSSTAAGSNSSIIGYNTVGSANENNDLGSLLANQYVATSTGTITTLNAYIDTVGASPTNHGEMALYSDSGGSPHTLLANSSSTVLTANSWNSFSIPSTSVTAGTNYWLVFESDSNTTGFANTTTNTQYPAVNESHTYSSALPTTWSTTASANGNEGSMYASILSSSSGTDSLSSGGNNIAILGKQSGTSTDTSDGNFMNCTQFTPSVGGTTSYMTVAEGTTSPSASFSFAIYTGTTTVPQTKVASSSNGTLTTTVGLNSLPINATLTAGTLYWLCVNNNDSNASTSDFTYNPSDGVATWFASRTFSSGWPASMGSGTTATGSIDISVAYTVGTSTSGLFKMTSIGQTTLQNVSNTINAFQVQDSNGGVAFNIDTADDFVGIGTASPHAQLEVSGDVYLGTQTLTANDQADVCLFTNSTCSAAQSGAFNNTMRIFGGSSQTRNIFLDQAVGGSAYLGSTFANLVIETTSNNASILLEPNGTGQVITSTIYAFNPNSAGTAETWHNLTIPSGWTDNSSNSTGFRYRMEPDGTVLLSVFLGAPSSAPANGTTIGTLPTGYIPASGQNMDVTTSVTVGSGVQSPHLFITNSGAIKCYGVSSSAVIGGNGILVLN